MPDFDRWAAPASWQGIEFISDLHLAPETALTVGAWERYMRSTQADAVIILGDLFEAWVGDDSRSRAFEAHCVEVLAATSRSRTVAFMAGNRDFLVGPEMLHECGMRPLRDPTLLVAFGQRFLLSHGDALCLADTEYQRFRRIVRDPSWQTEILARSLEERRALARALRAGSMERQSERTMAEWVDIDPATAVQWLESAESRCLIHGHTHRPGAGRLGSTHVRHVLSDWDMDHAAVGRAEVLRLDKDGLVRIPLC